MRPGTPAFLHAVAQAFLKLPMGFPFRWNTPGMIRPVFRWRVSVLTRCSSNVARSSGVMMNIRPSRFLVVPGSRRIVLALKSTWRQGKDLTPGPPAGDVGEHHHGLEVIGQVSADRVELLAVKKALPDVVLPEHGDLRRPVDPPAVGAPQWGHDSLGDCRGRAGLAGKCVFGALDAETYELPSLPPCRSNPENLAGQAIIERA